MGQNFVTPLTNLGYKVGVKNFCPAPVALLERVEWSKKLLSTVSTNRRRTFLAYCIIEQREDLCLRMLDFLEKEDLNLLTTPRPLGPGYRLV